METVPLDFPCWLCTDQHSDLESWRDHINSAHKLPLLYRYVLSCLVLCGRGEGSDLRPYSPENRCILVCVLCQ